MTNQERWLFYMKDFPSPDSFIEFGWYYIIAASLQRRVWIGPDHAKLYANIYPILVGGPGVGKGLVIKQVAEILKFHKLEDPAARTEVKSSTSNGEMTTEEKKLEKEIQEIIKESNYERAANKKSLVDKALLFPVAADATTYEALVRAMSKSIRYIPYDEFDKTLGRNTSRTYIHSSLCFVLEEISSLFRKRTEDVVHSLIQFYDCGNYEYDTKTQGKDNVRNCCLNFFGGTTPDFMQTSFDDKLLNEGFASRVWFIYETKNRFPIMWLPSLTTEQTTAWAEIVAHVKKLSTLYGGVTITPEAEQYLNQWWKIDAQKQGARANTSLKLDSYYARKNIHVLKLAMCLHFGESLEMTVGVETFRRAVEILHRVEAKMHYALGFEGSNPLGKYAKKIIKYLGRNGETTFSELLVEHFDEYKESELRDTLDYLLGADKIMLVREAGKNSVYKLNTDHNEKNGD